MSESFNSRPQHFFAQANAQLKAVTRNAAGRRRWSRSRWGTSTGSYDAGYQAEEQRSRRRARAKAKEQPAAQPCLPLLLFLRRRHRPPLSGGSTGFESRSCPSRSLSLTAPQASPPAPRPGRATSACIARVSRPCDRTPAFSTFVLFPAIFRARLCL